MAETIGQLVDRLAELELHRWHVEQLMRDPECLPAQFDTCQEHLKELDRQRSQLQQRIGRLWAARQGSEDGSPDPSGRRRGIPTLHAVDGDPDDTADDDTDGS